MAPDELERFSDERRDDPARDRISMLARHFARIARDLDARERRVERAVRVLQVGGALLIALGLVGWLALREQARDTDRTARATDRVAAQQTIARYQAVYTSCLERNKTNDGIIRYLRTVGASSADVRRARKFFPSEPRCKVYTKVLLGDDPPRGAFDIPEILRERTRSPSSSAVRPG